MAFGRCRRLDRRPRPRSSGRWPRPRRRFLPRKLDAIVAEAVELIKPPAGSFKAFHAQLTACIDAARRIHQAIANVPPPGEMKALATTYLKALERAREASGAMRSFYWSSDFA